MTLKIVIVNFRSVHYLRDCLTSLNSLIGCQITVLDNGSGNEEVVLLTELLASYPNARLVSSNENLGFGAGVNLAARSADIHEDDLVWVLNPDTTVARDAAAILEKSILEDRADIVSPLIASGPIEDERIWFAGGDIDMKRGRSYHLKHGRPLDEAPRFETSSGFITGAAPMFRGSVWLELGGFREDLFLYWEDADLSLRASALGQRLVMIPAARIWHREGGSSSQLSGLSPTYYYYAQRNRLVVCSEGLRRTKLAFIDGSLETARLLLKPLLRERDHRLRKFFASAAGLAAGLRGQTGRAALDWI